MKKVLLSVLVLVLLTGCVHHTPFTTEYFYQALGESGEIVMTADTERIKEGELDGVVDSSLKDNTIVKKSTRISASLMPDGDGYITSGAVEGNISSFTTNTALAFSSAFSREKEDGVKWYTDSVMSLYSPQNGVLLFTDGDYPEFYRRSYSEREMKIDDETAELMASAALSVYIFEPESLSELGFEIPDTVTAEMTRTCLLINRKDGELKLSGWIETTSEGTARALNTLLRNQIIQEKRRGGEKLDYSSLSTIFIVDGSSVKITDYTLTGEMREKASSLVREKIGGIL